MGKWEKVMGTLRVSLIRVIPKEKKKNLEGTTVRGNGNRKKNGGGSPCVVEDCCRELEKEAGHGGRETKGLKWHKVREAWLDKFYGGEAGGERRRNLAFPRYFFGERWRNVERIKKGDERKIEETKKSGSNQRRKTDYQLKCGQRGGGKFPTTNVLGGSKLSRGTGFPLKRRRGRKNR